MSKIEISWGLHESRKVDGKDPINIPCWAKGHSMSVTAIIQYKVLLGAQP